MKKYLRIYAFLCVLLLCVSTVQGCERLSDDRPNARKPDLIGAEAELEKQLSPAASVLWRTHCRACGHTYEYSSSDGAIGLTQGELASRFRGWSVTSFTREFAVLEREIDGYCPEHFLLFRKGKKLRVYSVSEPELELLPFSDFSIAPYEFSESELESLVRGIAFDSLIELDRYTEAHRTK